MKIYYITSALIIFLFLVSCGGNTPQKEECTSTPTAMFEDIAAFSEHKFNVTGQNSTESVRADSLYMDIELYQSGCTDLQQEFRFLLHGTIPQNILPQNCAMEIANIFYSLSQLDVKLYGLSQWAEAIRDNAGSFKYNEAVLLQGSGIRAKILKQHQPKSTVLTVVFSS